MMQHVLNEPRAGWMTPLMAISCLLSDGLFGKLRKRHFRPWATSYAALTVDSFT